MVGGVVASLDSRAFHGYKGHAYIKWRCHKIE
jgi:hypothetical protein